MRLSKVAKELNVGTANIVDHLASKGIQIEARPNTKISADAYDMLKQEFSTDVDQRKRSAEVSEARRKEKEAIKASMVKKVPPAPAKKEEVIKAKADIEGPKTVGKIEVEPKVEKLAPKPAVKAAEKAVEKVEEKKEVVAATQTTKLL